MSQFKESSINITELMNWKRNPLINPRTNRKIKENSILYKYIKNKYNETFPNGIDIFDSNDDRDPISLKRFYTIDTDNKKKLIYQNIEKLIIYQESESIVRCFEIESIQYLKTYNILTHPISQRSIPETIFNKIPLIEISNEMTVEEKALQVFQIFTNISIFIDYNLFLDLDREKLIKLNYELRDVYLQNLSIEDRKKIDNTDGKKFFKLNNRDMKEKNDDFIKMYLLEQIENILKYSRDDLKCMINYIILGGLSLVIDDVKQHYNNFNFSF